MNVPNKYYDELKRNIKERAAKLSSLRAEKERQALDECTFKPQVNPKSTKIAYKQVAEMHIGQKEFTKTYTNEAEETDSVHQVAKDQRIAQFLAGNTSEEKIAIVSVNTSTVSHKMADKRKVKGKGNITSASQNRNTG